MVRVKKSKVSFRKESLRGESTTTVCVVKYHCSNATEVAQYATPSCSRPQPATHNGVRDGTSN